MNKSKLQEFCQRRNWELPEYTTVKVGPDHMARFTAVVNVNGHRFETPEPCKSAKDAQNTAARIAFNHFNAPPPPPPAHALPTASSAVYPQISAVPPAALLPAVPPPVAPPSEVHRPVTATIPNSPAPSSLPVPPPGFLATKNDPQQSSGDATQASTVYRIAIGSNHKDAVSMYKNQLQQYGQKQNIGFPVYSSESEGPPHSRRFRSRVSLNGKSYETVEFFPTLKEAEQAAAKVACQELSLNVIQEDVGLHKNLLQEFAQRKGLLCPSYETTSSGMSHRPSFVSTVEVGSNTYTGAEAKTKKLAEMNAAKVAYCALTHSGPPTQSSRMPFVDGIAVADGTIKKHPDTTDEETRAQAKRAKSSPEKTNANTHLQDPSQHSNLPSSSGANMVYSQMENAIAAEPVTEQRVAENQPPVHGTTVVFSTNYTLPIPERASVMPYSDNQWIGYKVNVDQEPSS
ncbi:hypothetical protein ACP275_10G076500 [Erythranthe tilingii]